MSRLRESANCRFWMIAYGICVVYLIVAALGRGCVTIALASTICGFMVARNMADDVQQNCPKCREMEHEQV